MVASRQMADTSRTLQQLAAALGAQGASIEVLERRVPELGVRERALAAGLAPAGRAANPSAAAISTATRKADAAVSTSPRAGRQGTRLDSRHSLAPLLTSSDCNKKQQQHTQ